MSKIAEDFLSVRSLITIGAFFTAYLLVWMGKPVPDVILRIVDLLLGFWFGQKAVQLTQPKGDGK
jgi:hypothetical protein